MMDDPRDRTARPADEGASEPARYDRDFYSWAVEQAALLRAGRIAEADALNIAEELDDVGKQEYHRLESALRLILLHLLKWDRQPERRSRSWRGTILVQRNWVDKVLRDDPGLKPLVEKAVRDAYRDARIEAAVETQLGDDLFPQECPYGWTDIMERAIDWPNQE
jgi:Domain of unknown function DUF29